MKINHEITTESINEDRNHHYVIGCKINNDPKQYIFAKLRNQALFVLLDKKTAETINCPSTEWLDKGVNIPLIKGAEDAQEYLRYVSSFFKECKKRNKDNPSYQLYLMKTSNKIFEGKKFRKTMGYEKPTLFYTSEEQGRNAFHGLWKNVCFSKFE